MNASDTIWAVFLVGPLFAWVGWMVFVLPIQIAVDAFRHRGGRVPTTRAQRSAKKREKAKVELDKARAALPPQAEESADDDDADDDWQPYKSRRQMQHEWYGEGNSDLGWRDRVLGEALGIPNGDIYKSNWE